ncbi:MAG: hypothetical protein QOG61_457 [Candidatus Binataceae bacterium]|nr:hypothetical protein [Candidatus Binataceae bacterium]MEA2681180.1 hypothetical protein [Candidatus Binataceae bacterium]
MKVESENLYENELKHRFLGYYRREVEGQPVFIYRCICGYIEAVPVAGGPHTPLDYHFRPRADARSLVEHLNLERAHELN